MPRRHQQRASSTSGFPSKCSASRKTGSYERFGNTHRHPIHGPMQIVHRLRAGTIRASLFDVPMRSMLSPGCHARTAMPESIRRIPLPYRSDGGKERPGIGVPSRLAAVWCVDVWIRLLMLATVPASSAGTMGRDDCGECVVGRRTLRRGCRRPPEKRKKRFVCRYPHSEG